MRRAAISSQKNSKRRSPFAERLAKLRYRMDKDGLPAILIGNLTNVQYLTGFSGSAGALLVASGKSTFFSDSRYDIQAHEEVQGSTVKIVKGDALAAAAQWAAKSRAKRLGFEAGTVSYQTHQRLKELVPRARWVPTRGIVEELRVQKDPEEIELIRKAVYLGSRALEETLPLLRLGMTELEVAAEIEYRMRRYGGERPSFETIVATGPRSALPHARATSRRIRAKEFILLDLGVILDGYSSDMTRTVFLGKAPAKAAGVYKAVLEAILEGEEAVAGGRPGEEVDEAARKVLRRHGYERYFTHSTGH